MVSNLFKKRDKGQGKKRAFEQMPVNGYTENLENNTKLLKDFVQEKDSGLKGISTYSKSRLFYSNKGRT